MSSPNDQLAYVLINPYTIYKSRTGGVITRLFTRTALELVAARMFTPSAELTKEYAAAIVTDSGPEDRPIKEMIRQYVLDNYGPNPVTGRRRRVMMLVFRGEDAVRRVRQAVGPVRPGHNPAGETIRDTYGDYLLTPDGQVRYFEPAVLSAPTVEETEQKLKIWGRYSDTDGGILKNIGQYPEGAKIEQTLVLLKPDNFRFPSGRPGNIIDMLSRTGLYIAGIKVHRMSVAEAREFYGPVREVLRAKLGDAAGQRGKLALERELGFSLPAGLESKLGELLGSLAAENQFGEIVRFMTGRRPSECPPAEEELPGKDKIVAIIYEGVDAVAKIRNVLGPTDPSKAPPGTIRRELGQDIMVNAAHASDSPENAQREMKIIKIHDNNFKSLVEKTYNCKL